MSPIPFARPLSLAAAALVLGACADAETPLLNAGRAPSVASGGGQDLFVEVAVPHTPGSSMDSQAFDADGDGDLDLLIAKEIRPNVLLLNDGAGNLTVAPAGHVPGGAWDSEDVAVADFDRDGDLDAAIAGEDDRMSELYLNDGSGVFTTANDRLPARGVAQDVEVGDVDGDGDPDLVFGNVDDNRLLLNDGRGFFADAPERLPLRAAIEETREADLADVDGDGDLDLYFANLPFVAGADPQDRLLINDGRGWFTDQTAARIGKESRYTVDAEFTDVDRDGDLDLVTANLNDSKPYRVSLNDGTGVFKDATSSVFPSGLDGQGIDAEVADFNGDGRLDIYFSSYIGTDRMVLARP